MLLALAPGVARADCAATPIADPDDMVVSFLKSNGVQSASASLFPSTIKEGMLVYDGSAKALKLCDGTNWQSISMGTASDLRIGTLTANKWCAVNAAGDTIDCTQNSPTASAAGTDGQIQFNSGGNFAADSNLFWDNTNKRLGIGTATPTETLDIAGALSATNSSLALPDPGSGGKAVQANLSVTIAPSTDYTAAAGGYQWLYGAQNTTTVSSSTTAADLSRLYITGFQNNLTYQASAPITQIIGNANGVTYDSSGAVSQLTSVNGSIRNISTAVVGTATGMIGSVSNNSTGAITTAYGLRSGIVNTNASGTITNAYGLYLTKTNNGTITNNWGIYQADTANNYLGGALGIGQSSPQAKLDVNGGARVGADATCTAAKAGMLAWNSNKLQVCTDAGTFTDIASSSGGSSQWVNGASGAIYYNGGNVGIGTATPGTKLQVVGGLSVTSGSTASSDPGPGNLSIGGAILEISKGTNSVSEIRNQFNGSQRTTISLWPDLFTVKDVVRDNYNLYSVANNSDSFVGAVSARPIGPSSNPTNRYTTFSDYFVSNFGAVVGRDGSGGTPPVGGFLRSANANATATDVLGANLVLQGGLATGAAASGDILFQTGDAGVSGGTLQTASPKMIVKSSGKVGIGTTAPNAKLSLGANTGPYAFLINDYGTLRRGMGIDNIGPWSTSVFGVTNGTNTGGLVFGNVSSDGNYTFTPQMTIRNLGNVGIGTADPQSKLQVGGGIQMADDADSCPGASNAKAGTLRYNTDKIQFCKTTGWTDMASSGTGDNLGDHIATQNIRLGGYYLSGDGGNEGLLVDSGGKVTVSNLALPANGVITMGTPSTTSKQINISSANPYAGMFLEGTWTTTTPTELLALKGASDTTNISITSTKANAVSAIYLNTDNTVGAGVGSISHGGAFDGMYFSTGSYASGGMKFFTVQGGATFSDSQANDIKLYKGSITIAGLSTAYRSIGVDRSPEVDTAGRLLTLYAGGASASASDKNGGDLLLSSGLATGSGSSSIQFQTATPGASGTGDRYATTKMTVLGNGNVGIGTTSPAAPLHVVGGIKTNGGLSSTIYNAGGMFIDFDGATNLGRLITSNASSNAMAFYVGASGNATEKMRLDSNGNLGIGTTAPDSRLHVSGGLLSAYPKPGQADFTSAVFSNNNNATIRFHHVGGYTRIHTDTGQSIRLATNGENDVITVTSGGNVGIGTTGPSYKLDVTTSGTAIHGNNAGGGAYGVMGDAGAGGWGIFCNTGFCGGYAVWTNASDKRLKTAISDLEEKDGLDAVMRLRPVRYRWKDSQRDAQNGEQLGFIAQEVEKILPEVVSTSDAPTTIKTNDGESVVVEHPKAMSYATVVVPLVKAVQELKADNDNLRAELNAANDNYRDLRQELDALKASLH